MADVEMLEAQFEPKSHQSRLGKLLALIAFGLGLACLLIPNGRPGDFGFRRLQECFHHGVSYGTPTDISRSQVSTASPEACQKKCANSVGCMQFSFWPDGRCLLTDVKSEPRASPDAISGPALCPEHHGEEPFAATAKTTAAKLRGRGADGGFGPKGPWQDYDPYDPPDNDGLNRRLGSGPGHDQESKAPEPEAQKIATAATAKAGAAHPSQSNDDDGFGPKGPWQDYDPYDPPDNDGLSRRSGSGPGHDQESKAPEPEAQKIATEATAKAGAAHPSQSNDDDGFGPKGPWQDYDPYDPPDNDGLSRRSGSGPGHDQESKAPEPEAQKIATEANAKAGAAHPSQSNDDDGFGPKGP